MWIDFWQILSQLAYYFPYYVGLVLAPMLIRVVVEYALGIRPEMFEEKMFGLSYESAFRSVVLTVLYFPLFEELVFRGIPFMLFGLLGLIVGSIVWVAMHPAWQLQYLSSLPLWKRVAFTISSTFYYSLNTIFYCTLWMNGAGLVAILYHMIHNGWLTFVDIIRKVELPAPWKRYKFTRREPVAEKGLKLPFRRKSSGGEEEEEEGVKKPFTFVIRKQSRSLGEEVEEIKYVFVRRKLGEG